MRVVFFGNMGSGKTTLINNLAKLDTDYIIMQEEITKEEIDDFYGSGMQNALEHEMLVLLKEVRKYRKSINHEGKIMLFDRSFFDPYVFTKCLHRYGKISNVEMRYYSEFYKTMTLNFTRPFDYYVYFKSDVNYLYDNIMKRGTNSEATVDKKYIQLLNDSFHDTWQYLHDKHEDEYGYSDSMIGKFVELDHVTETNEKRYNDVIKNIDDEFHARNRPERGYFEIKLRGN
jgi:deoxyadenosine/deoxycytidine kinase